MKTFKVEKSLNSYPIKRLNYAFIDNDNTIGTKWCSMYYFMPIFKIRLNKESFKLSNKPNMKRSLNYNENKQQLSELSGKYDSLKD